MNFQVGDLFLYNKSQIILLTKILDNDSFHVEWFDDELQMFLHTSYTVSIMERFINDEPDFWEYFSVVK